MIAIDTLSQIEMRIGTVKAAENVEGSEKLIKLTVDFGEANPRQILTGMRKWKTPVDFIDRQLLFVTNLEPRKMMGLESQGMILAVDGKNETPILLQPEAKVPNGAKIR